MRGWAINFWRSRVAWYRSAGVCRYCRVRACVIMNVTVALVQPRKEAKAIRTTG